MTTTEQSRTDTRTRSNSRTLVRHGVRISSHHSGARIDDRRRGVRISGRHAGVRISSREHGSCHGNPTSARRKSRQPVTATRLPPVPAAERPRTAQAAASPR